MSITWSYSNLSLYQQCPKKYYHLRVAKDIKEAPSEALSFGNEIHKIAQEYIDSDRPIPEKYVEVLQAPLDKLKSMKGQKLCENKLGLTADLKPCGFFDKQVWWRGIADLIILQDDMAFTVDYKTGKSSKYADLKQLEVLSLAIFKHFPHVKKVKAGLMFLFAEDFVKADYHSDQQDELWSPWFLEVGLLEDSVNSGVWNAKPNFTCRGYCPVTSCAHNQGERK
jgi:PD-(D/E)XK nuclease superfamily